MRRGPRLQKTEQELMLYLCSKMVSTWLSQMEMDSQHSTTLQK